MSIVGIERDRAKENKRKREVVAKIRDMQFVRSVPVWRQGVDCDSTENYILLRVMNCGGNVGLIMWRTTAKQEKLEDDVVLIETNYTNVAMDKKSLVRQVKDRELYSDISIGGMYNLDKDRGYIRVDDCDDMARAKILAKVVDGYKTDTRNTDVERHILNEVSSEVYDMVHNTVVEKAKSGSMGYYCLVLQELNEDKKLSAQQVVDKWMVWDRSMSVDNDSVSR